MAFIIPAITAAYGAYEQHQQTNAQREAARRAGGPSSFETFTDPWGPTVDLRQAGLNRAFDLFQNYTPQFNPYRPGGRGRGGGSGVSSQSQEFARLLAERARGTELLGGAEDLLSRIMRPQRMRANGDFANPQGSYNPMLFQLWNEGAPENQYLTQFLNQHINDPAFSGGSQDGDGPRNEVGALSSEGYLNRVLGGEFLREGNPYANDLVDNISRRIRENYTNEDIPGINSAANRIGRFGSQPWEDLQSRAADSFQRNLGDVATNVLFDQYNLERGFQGDASRTLAGIDVARMNEEGQRINSDRAMDSNNMAALLSAIGQYGQNQQFGRSYLGSLAGQYSGDMLGAAGLAPGINQAELNNIGAASQAQHQIDQQRAAARQRQLAYDVARWNFEQELPFNQLSNFGRFIDMFGGGFGRTHGTSQGPAQMYTGPSQFGSALGGAIQGWQTGQDIYGLYNQWRMGRQGGGGGGGGNPQSNPYGNWGWEDV